LKEKVAFPVYKSENMALVIHKTLALTSPTSGGRSAGIVHLRTKATDFSFFMFLFGALAKRKIGP
jgi:hypothetical protein